MDLINDKLSKIYLKYLTAAFGSAFMGSVFGLVDMVMVGQYHGPEGRFSLASPRAAMATASVRRMPTSPALSSSAALSLCCSG